MLYMVVERFRDRDRIYRRFDEKGRMLPDGLSYVSSWVDKDLTKCFQLMETNDPALFEKWTSNWDDLADFEVVPVFTSDQVKERLLKQE